MKLHDQKVPTSTSKFLGYVSGFQKLGQIASCHVFAMDNLDWKKKTLGGGSFNAIVIENQVTASQSMREEGVTLSVPTSGSQTHIQEIRPEYSCWIGV